MNSFQTFKPGVGCSRVCRVCRVLALGAGFKNAIFATRPGVPDYTHPYTRMTPTPIHNARSPPSFKIAHSIFHYSNY